MLSEEEISFWAKATGGYGFFILIGNLVYDITFFYFFFPLFKPIIPSYILFEFYSGFTLFLR